MRRLALALLATAAFTQIASAADLPMKAPVKAVPMVAVYNWTGFYVGAHAGYAWGSSESVAIGGSNIVLISQPTTVPRAVGISPKGFLGGAQIGYNAQFNRMVVGIEADFSGANIRDSQNVDLPAATPVVRTTASEKISSLGTIRARLGMTPSDRLLAYVTGGFAFGRVNYSGNINEFFNTVPARQFNANSTVTKTGWTIGGGLEWAFANNWSLKGEYLYYNLGSTTITGPQTNPVVATEFATYAFTTKGSIARVGANYKFN